MIYRLFEELIRNNNLFKYETREKIEEITNKYANNLDEEQISTIKNSLNFNPEEFSLDDLSIELEEPNFKDINNNDIQTFIYFFFR